jgi:DMSO/TMAO reductase YedYZ molybdopterin-dependent catalytic subunit
LNIKKKLEIIKEKKLILGFTVLAILIGASVIFGITFLFFANSSEDNLAGFPDFITKNEDYFEVHIDDIPEIDKDTYQLKVWGQINNPKNFSYSELQALDLIERTLTTECIGNSPKSKLVSTAVWKGFLMYDFITALGLKEDATGLKYLAADGYYVSHTIEQLKNNGTIGALYMNGVASPPNQGFPLRIVNPGSYGAKQPAWVIEIEVIDRPLEDYWDDRRWDTSPPMAVDSIIFFPDDNVRVRVGSPLEIGGAAYGGTRISKVEYTIDRGLNWSQANIVKGSDLDHVWIFWKTSITFNSTGNFVVNTKATDIYYNSQPEIDDTRRDGYNPWPTLTVIVVN